MIVIDNVFLGGQVIDATRQGEGIRAIRRLNETLHYDERVDMTLVPIRRRYDISAKAIRSWDLR